MKCQFCSKPKLYEVTEIKDGQVISLQLCETCFRSYIANSPTPQNFQKIQMPKVPDTHLAAFNPEIANKFVQDMIQFVESLVGQLPPKSNKKCKCGLTLEDLMKTGKLGCPNCYEYYKDELSQILFLSHGAPNNKDLVHKGKTPKNLPKEATIKETPKMLLTKLRYKLARAIEEEEYEQAAKIRDEIKVLTCKKKPNPKNDEDQLSQGPES